jgi:hypothetical protein
LSAIIFEGFTSEKGKKMSAIAKIDIAALTERAKNILMTPEKEWDKIDGEKPLLPELFTGYAAILAAVPAVCSFIGLLGTRAGIGVAISFLVLSYVQSLLMVAAGGFVADFLAPQFGGKSDRISAFKLIVYSVTPVWVVGALGLLPVLGRLTILALAYTAYLIYLGAPKLMKVPQDKNIGYTAVTLIAIILANGLIMALMRS